MEATHRELRLRGEWGEWPVSALLQRVTALTHLDLHLVGDAHLTDLDLLAASTSLTDVVLTVPDLCDAQRARAFFAPLAGLLRLRSLTVHDSTGEQAIVEVNAEEAVEEVERRANAAAYVAALADLFTLYDCRVSDARPLEALTRLVKLELMRCGQVAWLPHLPSLTRLSHDQGRGGRNEQTDLAPLHGCTRLEHLEIHMNKH